MATVLESPMLEVAAKMVHRGSVPADQLRRRMIGIGVVFIVSIATVITVAIIIALAPPLEDKGRMLAAFALLLGAGTAVLSLMAWATVSWSAFLRERILRLQAQSREMEALGDVARVLRSVAARLQVEPAFARGLAEICQRHSSGEPVQALASDVCDLFAENVSDEMVLAVADNALASPASTHSSPSGSSRWMATAQQRC